MSNVKGGHVSTRDERERQPATEWLMQPGNYTTRAHRSRRMPQRKPRLTAKESEKSTLAWTSETPRESNDSR